MTYTPYCKYRRSAELLRRYAECKMTVSHEVELIGLALLLEDASDMRARLAAIDARPCEIVHIADRMPKQLRIPVRMAHETPDGAA